MLSAQEVWHTNSSPCSVTAVPKVCFAFTDHPITVLAVGTLLRLYFLLIGLRASATVAKRNEVVLQRILPPKPGIRSEVIEASGPMCCWWSR
ncbi:MAG: hypothetical protein CV088_10740 [Nitrospira sp. LK70]|nr:hypothetical protein [Nitrospira sp. LK70]